MAYVLNDPVVLGNTFRVAGVLTDPTTVSLTVSEPDGTSTTYTYAAAEITKLATGTYEKVIIADAVGQWTFVWSSTGSAADVADGYWVVEPTTTGRRESTDILTLAEARHALNIRDAMDDSETDREIAAVISAASQFVDKELGPVVVRTISNERHAGGRGFIHLRKYPVSAVTTLTEYSAGAATVLTAESETVAGNYRIDYDSGTIQRRRSWTSAYFAGQSVVVTYVAGRFADTASVDAIYKEAAVIALHHFWQVRGAGNGAQFGSEDTAAFGAAPYSTAELSRQVRAKVYGHDPIVV